MFSICCIICCCKLMLHKRKPRFLSRCARPDELEIARIETYMYTYFVHVHTRSLWVTPVQPQYRLGGALCLA